MAEQTTAQQSVTRRNEKVGQVVSDKMQKTIVVEVTRRVSHPMYKRIITRRKKFYAHDEQQTAKMPSDWFLWAALGSIGASLTLMIGGRAKAANFVGQWAPTFLMLGLYNKMVKLHGSEGQ